MNPILPTIRPAQKADAPLILALIRELAAYEKLEHEVRATVANLETTLFGEHPAAEVLLAFVGEEAAGYALFFSTYSTFLARPGVYLEDLFVREAWRGRGLGTALLKSVARVVHDRGGGRLEWSVLDWNVSSVGFYRSLGAEPLDEWTMFRVTGAALERLAE